MMRMVVVMMMVVMMMGRRLHSLYMITFALLFVLARDSGAFLPLDSLQFAQFV